MEAAPAAIGLIAPYLVQYAQQPADISEAKRLLHAAYAQHHSLDVLDAIVALETNGAGAESEAREWYARHLGERAILGRSGQVDCR